MSHWTQSIKNILRRITNLHASFNKHLVLHITQLSIGVKETTALASSCVRQKWSLYSIEQFIQTSLRDYDWMCKRISTIYFIPFTRRWFAWHNHLQPALTARWSCYGFWCISVKMIYSYYYFWIQYRSERKIQLLLNFKFRYIHSLLILTWLSNWISTFERQKMNDRSWVLCLLEQLTLRMLADCCVTMSRHDPLIYAFYWCRILNFLLKIKISKKKIKQHIF